MGGRANTHPDPALRLVKRSSPKVVTLPKGVAAAGASSTPLLKKSITPTIPLAKPEAKPKAKKPLSKPKAHLIEARDVVKKGDKAYFKGVSRGLTPYHTKVVGKKADLTAAQIKKGPKHHNYNLEDFANKFSAGAKDAVLGGPQTVVQLTRAASAEVDHLTGNKRPTGRPLLPSDGPVHNGRTAAGRKVTRPPSGRGQFVEATAAEQLATQGKNEKALKDVKRALSTDPVTNAVRAEMELATGVRAKLTGRPQAEVDARLRNAKSRITTSYNSAKENPFQAITSAATVATVAGKLAGLGLRGTSMASRALKPVKILETKHVKGKQGTYKLSRKYQPSEQTARPAAMKRNGQERAVVDNANRRTPEGKRKRAVQLSKQKLETQRRKARTPGDLPDAHYAPHSKPFKRAGQKLRDYATPRITGRAVRTEGRLTSARRLQTDLTNAQARTRNVGLAGEKTSVKAIVDATKAAGYGGRRMHGKGLKGQAITLAALHATDTLVPADIARGATHVDGVLAKWTELQHAQARKLTAAADKLEADAAKGADGAVHREQARSNRNQVREIQRAVEDVSRVRKSLGGRKPKLFHDGNVAQLAEAIRKQGAASDAAHIEAAGLGNESAVTGGMAGQSQTSAAAYTSPAKLHGLIEKTATGKAFAKPVAVDAVVRERAHETPKPEDTKPTQTVTTGKEPVVSDPAPVVSGRAGVPWRTVNSKAKSKAKRAETLRSARRDSSAPVSSTYAHDAQNVNPIDHPALAADHAAMVHLHNYKEATIAGDHVRARAELKAAYKAAPEGGGSMASAAIADINHQLGHRGPRRGAVVEHGKMTPAGKAAWAVARDPAIVDGPTPALIAHHQAPNVGVTHTPSDAAAIDLGAAKRAHAKAIEDLAHLTDSHARLEQQIHKGPAHQRQLDRSQAKLDAKKAEIASLADSAGAKLPDEKPLGRNSAAQRAAILDDLKATDGGPSTKYEYHTSSDVSGVINDGLKMGDVSGSPIMEHGYGTVVHVFKKGAVDRRSQLHGPRDAPPKPIATFTHAQLGIHPDSLVHGHRAEDLGDGPQPPMEWTPAEKAALAAQDARAAQAISDAYPNTRVTLGAPTTKPLRERPPSSEEKLSMKPGDKFYEPIPNKFQWRGVQKGDLPGLLDRRHGEIIDAAHNPNVRITDTNAMMVDFNDAIRSGPRIGAFDRASRDARMKAIRNEVKAIRKAKARREAPYDPPAVIGSTNGPERADAYAKQDAQAASEGKPPPPKDPIEQTNRNITERHAAIEEPTVDTFTEQMNATVEDILKEEPRLGPGDVHDAYQWTDSPMVRKAESDHNIKLVGTPFSAESYRLVTGVKSKYQPYFGRTVSIGTEAPRITANKMGRTSDILNQKNPLGQVSLAGILRTEASKPRVASKDAFQQHLVNHTAMREITLPDGTTQVVVQDPSMGPAIAHNAADAKALVAKAKTPAELIPGPKRRIHNDDHPDPFEATYYVVDHGAARYYNQLIKQPNQFEVAIRAIGRNFVRSVLPMSLGWQVMNPFEHAMRMAFLMSREGLNPAGTQRAVNRIETQIKAAIAQGTVRPTLLDEFRAQTATHSGALKNQMVHATTGDLRGGLRHPVSQIGQWVRSAQTIPMLGLVIKAPKGLIDHLLTLSSKVEHASSWQLRMQAHQEFINALTYTDKTMKDVNTVEHLVEQIDKNPALLPVLHNKIAEICGDYIRQSPFQARLAGGPVPFLTWIRESMKFVGKTLPNRSPLRLELALLSSRLTEDERLKLGMNWLHDPKDLKAAGLPAQPNTIYSQYAADFGGGVRLSFVNASGIGQVVAMVYDPLGSDVGSVFPMISRGMIRYLHPDNPNQQNLPLTDPARLYQAAKAGLGANVPFAGAAFGAFDPPGATGGIGATTGEHWDSKTGKMVPGQVSGGLPLVGKETFLESDHKPPPTPTLAQRIAGALHVPFQDAKPYGPNYPTAAELTSTNAAYNDRQQRNAAGISPTEDLKRLEAGKKLSPTPLPQGLADLRDPATQAALNAPRSGRPDMTNRWYPGEKAAHAAHIKAANAQFAAWEKLGKTIADRPDFTKWSAKQPNPLDLEIVKYDKFHDRVLKDPVAQAKWDKANGVVLNKKVQPKAAASGVLKGGAKGPAFAEKLIDAASTEYGVDPALIRAVMRAESDFSPGSGSSAGAVGLMQLMPFNANGIDINNNKDNVFRGVSMLHGLLKRYKGNIPLALAGYNAGEGAVAQAGNRVPNYPETQAYVAKIVGELNGATHVGSGAVSTGPSGSPAKIINSLVLKDAHAVGIMRTQAENDAGNASHGPTNNGGRSDHQGPGNVAWAADMSNGSSPTPEMDKLAAKLAKRFHIPWTGSGLVDHTEGGYRYQLIYRAPDHFDHVHLGIRLADPGAAGDSYTPGGGMGATSAGSGTGGGGGTTPTSPTDTTAPEAGSSYDSIQSLLNSDSTDSQAFIDALHKRRKKKL